MNETAIAVLAGVGIIGAAFMFNSGSEKMRKSEEERFVQEMIREGATRDEAIDLAERLPLLRSDTDRNLWRETLTDNVQAFLNLDGNYQSMADWARNAQDEGTRSVIDQLSIQDIRHLTENGPFEFFPFGIELLPIGT